MRWMAKHGDGWLSRKMGGYAERWVAKGRRWVVKGERWVTKQGVGWLSRKMGGYVGRWKAMYREVRVYVGRRVAN
jgi:hypothetical protein